MAYNEKLSQKVQALLQQIPGMKSKQMFGGIGFLLHGHMACGILLFIFWNFYKPFL
jgi:TfoX/Sxy family transcriptional regulator of competence genes